MYRLCFGDRFCHGIVCVFCIIQHLRNGCQVFYLSHHRLLNLVFPLVRSAVFQPEYLCYYLRRDVDFFIDILDVFLYNLTLSDFLLFGLYLDSFPDGFLVTESRFQHSIFDFKVNRDAFDAFYYGQDFGYNHANAILGVGWKDGEVYICSEIYVFEKDTEEIIGLANQAKVDRRVEMFCDSAEPDRIKTWQKDGFRAYPVKKEPGSVKAQIDWLKGRKIHIHPSCVNVLKEVQQWKWKKDPTTGLYIDEPVEFMDDAMAALRYSVERLRRGSAIEVLK